MYTHRNFKKGTDVRLAVAAYLLALAANDPAAERKAVTYYQPGPFGGNEKQDDDFVLEGPHFPAPHSWYLKAVSRGGKVVWVNGLPAVLNPNNSGYNFTKGIEALKKKFPQLVAVPA